MQDGKMNLHWVNLIKIPAGLRTLEMYLDAFEHKEMTPELALGLMEDYPEAIMVLPDEFKTPEICFLAGKEDLQGLHRDLLHLWRELHGCHPEPLRGSQNPRVILEICEDVPSCLPTTASGGQDA
jgi:hypothetical protein